ncbi:MAG: hypothetical protein LBK50_01795 [Candidatus Nomurabacteria bacterium]|jgi:hypothetical protein|nr:hypothetical protein [Candidatus Nomurabacteria bacterium]
MGYINYKEKKKLEYNPDGSFRKERVLHVPNEKAREAGAHIVRMLVELRDKDMSDLFSRSAVGGIKGRGLRDNVMPHRKNKHFVMYDLKDAYPNTRIGQLASVILRPDLIYSEHELVANREELSDNTYRMLHDCMLVDEETKEIHGLPQGGTASPFLLNLSCIPLDEKLDKYCREQNLTYTRFIDDFTISSLEPIGKKRQREIKEIITSRPNTIINDKKTRKHSLDNKPVIITGVSLYPDGRIEMSPPLARKIESFYDYVLEAASSGDIDQLDELWEDENSMRGKINGYHSMIKSFGYTNTPLHRRLERKYRAALGRWEDSFEVAYKMRRAETKNLK